MTHQNLILSEKAIKSHSKRLQKQMKNYNQDLSLGESQTLLSKILGFNDWNHLNKILKTESSIFDEKTVIENTSSLLASMPDKSLIFHTLSADEIIQIFISLLNRDSSDTSILKNRAITLISSVIPALIYMRDSVELYLSADMIREYLKFTEVLKLYVTRRDLPRNIRADLYGYLASLPIFQKSISPNDFNEITKVFDFNKNCETHEAIQNQFFFILKYLEKIENNNFTIADKQWFFKSNNKNGYSSNFCIELPNNDGWLIFNENLHDIEFLDDSWIVMPEYHEYIRLLYQNNKLNKHSVFDLIIHITKIISPQKRRNIEILLNNILEHYSLALNISNQIQKSLKTKKMILVDKFEKIIEKAISLNSNKIILRNINNDFNIEIITNENSIVLVEFKGINNDVILFCEMIFDILKTSPKKIFNVKESQNGKVSYKTKNINKIITYKSFSEVDGDFSILLTLS